MMLRRISQTAWLLSAALLSVGTSDVKQPGSDAAIRIAEVVPVSTHPGTDDATESPPFPELRVGACSG